MFPVPAKGWQRWNEFLIHSARWRQYLSLPRDEDRPYYPYRSTWIRLYLTSPWTCMECCSQWENLPRVYQRSLTLRELPKKPAWIVQIYEPYNKDFVELDECCQKTGVTSDGEAEAGNPKRLELMACNAEDWRESMTKWFGNACRVVANDSDVIQL